MLQRALALRRSVETFHGKLLSLELICADWLSDAPLGALRGQFDLVFNVGVIEHYLQKDRRVEFLRRKLDCLRPGGYLVSIVPSGIHPLRRDQVANGWGGYVVPETNYDPAQVEEEAISAGAKVLSVMGHAHLGHLLMKPGSPAARLMRRGLVMALKPVACLPDRWIPPRFAYSLVLVAMKI